MKEAFKEAQKAYLKDEVPVGAVVVYNDKIIARAHNLREKNQSFMAHAEFLAMQKASKKLGSWRLEDCDVYVTLEPCPMCAGAMIQGRVRHVYYAAQDNKAGATGSVIDLFETPFNHKVLKTGGIMADESKFGAHSVFKFGNIKDATIITNRIPKGFEELKNIISVK